MITLRAGRQRSIALHPQGVLRVSKGNRSNKYNQKIASYVGVNDPSVIVFLLCLIAAEMGGRSDRSIYLIPFICLGDEVKR